jgi:hypothetical protein
LHANVSALKPNGSFAEIVLKHRWRIDPPPHAEDSVSGSIRGRFAMPIFDEIGRFGAALRKARRKSQAIGQKNALPPELQKMELPDDKPFGQAVAVYGHRAGDVFNIGSAREALDWLRYEWPDGVIDSVRMRAARQACVAALDGGDAEIARLAFRLAVVEAGNLIGDVDRVHKPSSADPSFGAGRNSRSHASHARIVIGCAEMCA